MTVITKEDPTHSGGSLSGRPNDPRKGWNNTPSPNGDIYGAAVGMCIHLSSGIFCGLDGLDVYARVPGLYVVSDGANGSVVSGATYSNGVDFTSSFCSIQGWRAGNASAKYASGIPLTKITSGWISIVSQEILAPMAIKTGLDLNWARDVLQALMALYWIHIAKPERTLQGALAQVEHLRNKVVHQLMAASSHDLRLCHEINHKVLSAEMKLRGKQADAEMQTL